MLLLIIKFLCKVFLFELQTAVAIDQLDQVNIFNLLLRENVQSLHKKSSMRKIF